MRPTSCVMPTWARVDRLGVDHIGLSSRCSLRNLYHAFSTQTPRLLSVKAPFGPINIIGSICPSGIEMLLTHSELFQEVVRFEVPDAKQIETIEHNPASAQHVFPPLDKQTFPSQLFWLALTFIALYLLMSRIALPRVASILEDRRKRVESELAEAQRFKGESDAAIAAREKSLMEARERAQTVANERRAKAAAAAEARRKEVDANLAARISEAQKSIAAARSAAIANIQSIAKETAGGIVERLTRVTPTKQDIDDAVTSVLKRQD